MGHVTESNHTREPAAAGFPAEPPVVVGWREWAGLPDALTPWIKAKIDTGARTSALHAFRIERHTGPHGEDRVRFEVHPWQGSTADARTVDLPVEDVRTVRSSNGDVQDRFVVLMPLRLAGRTVDAEVTLTDRDEMGFRMLIGREVLSRGFLVDCARSYAGGIPPRAIRRRNWGKR